MPRKTKAKRATLDYRELAAAPSVNFLRSSLRTVVDFPKPGIRFKDIHPLLQDPRALQVTLDLLAQPFVNSEIDQVAAMEARGFIFGCALAVRLESGFIPVRKPGKLPPPFDEVSYSLEYGENTLQMRHDSLEKGARVLIVDDLLATGDTAAATIELVHKQGGEVAGVAFLCELTFLPGRDKLRALLGADVPIHALIPIGAED